MNLIIYSEWTHSKQIIYLLQMNLKQFEALPKFVLIPHQTFYLEWYFNLNRFQFEFWSRFQFESFMKLFQNCNSISDARLNFQVWNLKRIDARHAHCIA